MKKHLHARLAARPEDYERLGIKKEIASWEDGLRTSGKFGEYEWWYSDTRMDNGDSLVIVFYSQPVTASVKGFAPSISFDYTKNGEALSISESFSIKDCSFAKERCCVRMGENVFEGDLKNYHIYFKNDRVEADLYFKGSTPSWRPDTGHIFFNEKKYFAWLPSIPEGRVSGTLIVDGETIEVGGTGYHDHNWGNTGMFWLMHHWYWGRAKIGDYQIISSYITAHEKYGYEHFPIFFLAKNGVKIADDPMFLTYRQSEPEFDSITKKTYHKKLVYEYNDGLLHYRITYSAEDIIEYFNMAEAKNRSQTQSNPLLLGFVRACKLNPSYIRMVGTVTLEKFDCGELIEKLEEPGIWEQMHFGLDEDV